MLGSMSHVRQVADSGRWSHPALSFHSWQSRSKEDIATQINNFLRAKVSTMSKYIYYYES